MKIIVTIIPLSLVTSSLSSLPCPFIETKNKNQIFSNLVVWLREIVLLIVYSESRSASKVCQIQRIEDVCKRIFLHVIPVRIIVPWY